ncbi:MAG: hypothetical protein M0R06_04825 [Sphaerochaeta sp.]|jgi:hypothetical protein|nr:hypothetical protein [Sphaerochaeta sp.]
MTAEERKELDEIKTMLATVIAANGNGKGIRPWLGQGMTTLFTAFLLAGAFFLFGLPEKITATAETKAQNAIQHYSEVLNPRLTAIETNIADIKTNVGEIQKTMLAESKR